MHGNHSYAPDHPCRHCRWWGGPDSSGAHALCERPKTSRVCAQPDRGCAFFEREPGADDEPGWTPIVVTHSPGVWAPNVVPPNGGAVQWAP
jgi:hypothetical protein